MPDIHRGQHVVLYAVAKMVDVGMLGRDHQRDDDGVFRAAALPRDPAVILKNFETAIEVPLRNVHVVSDRLAPCTAGAQAPPQVLDKAHGGSDGNISVLVWKAHA